MSDDFSQVKLNVAGQTVSLSGKVLRASTVTLAATLSLAPVDDATPKVDFPVSIPNFPIVLPVGAKITAASDTAGRTWTIAADGQSVTVA